MRFFPAHYKRMNERTACALFPEDEISAEDNCISHPRANVQFVVSTAVVAEYAGYSAHLFSHETPGYEARPLCYAHEHRHRTVASFLGRGAHLHLKFTRLYVPTLISGTFKLVQLPLSNHLVALNFHGAQAGVRPRR